METSTPKILPEKLIDPIIDFLHQKKNGTWMLDYGTNNFKQQDYTTVGDQNAITFTNNMTQNIVVDRSNFVVNVPITVTISSTGTGSGNVYDVRYLVFRSIEYGLENLILSLNSQSLAYPVSDLIYSKQYFQEVDNTCGTQRDYCQQYSDIVGSNRSPFADANTCVSEEKSRRACQYVNVVSNTTTSAVLEVLFQFNLKDYPPFTKSKTDVGLMYCSTFSIQLQFGSYLKRVVSIANNHPNTGINGVSFSIGTSTLANPVLTTLQYSIPQDIPIPPSVNYDYSQITVQKITTGSALPQYTSVTGQASATMVLQSVPTYLYLYVKPATSYVLSGLNACTTPMAYAKINSVSISIGAKNGLLANLTDYNLYQISEIDQKRISYNDFKGLGGNGNVDSIGSIIRINPSRYLSISDQFIMGSPDKIILQAYVNYTTLCPTTCVHEIVLVSSIPNYLTWSPNSMTLSGNINVNPKDVPFTTQSYESLKMEGEGAKEFFKKVFQTIDPVLRETRLLSKASKLIPAVGPYVSDALDKMGYSWDKPDAIGIGGASGNALAGGQIVPRNYFVRQAQKRMVTRR